MNERSFSFYNFSPVCQEAVAATAGFQAAFIVSAAGGLVIAALLFWLVRDPRPRQG